MDPAWVGLIIIIVINIFGWGVTTGKLNGRIKHLEQTVDRHEQILGSNGLATQISTLSSRCSTLEGTVKTYIDLHKRGEER
jgi:hypothetical protein